MFFGFFNSARAQNPGKKGYRPYELDWAGWFTDDLNPLVDFENMNGWKVEADRVSAKINRSQEQIIWGNDTCKIAYKGDTAGAGLIIRQAVPEDRKSVV